MRKISTSAQEALHDSKATRLLEQAQATLHAPGTLMARAGLAVARLARALAPHAQTIWVACGPGNNGGDGLVAARHLHAWALENDGMPRVVVTHRANKQDLPEDAARALRQAREAGVNITDGAPDRFDLAIDALFGIGSRRPAEGRLADDLVLLGRSEATVLCVDTPSDLDADTGITTFGAPAPRHGQAARGPRHTISLLTLKPGLFTGAGRDSAGVVWFDDLDCASNHPPVAWLAGHVQPSTSKSHHSHARHKGSYGDVAVIGGQHIAINGSGMTGAAVLAARAALHAGAGRVLVGLLSGATAPPVAWDPVAPELMFREPTTLIDSDLFRQASVVCGCGGGTQMAPVLPQILSRASRLVLDADALNTLAGDTGLQALLLQRKGRGWITVLTPHPLEAARLLDVGTADVMSDRLTAGQQLADRFHAVCVLKGSGTVIAAPGQTPLINPTGNATLATAGTGDVLAGLLGAALSSSGGTDTLERVAGAVFQHGWLADSWDDSFVRSHDMIHTLTASRLASLTRPVH